MKLIISAFYDENNLMDKKVKNYPTLCERILNQRVSPSDYSNNLYTLENNLNEYLTDMRDVKKTEDQLFYTNFDSIITRLNNNHKFKKSCLQHKVIFILIYMYCDLKLKQFISKRNKQNEMSIFGDTYFENFVSDMTEYKTKYKIYERFIKPIFEIFQEINGNECVITLNNKTKELKFIKSI